MLITTDLPINRDKFAQEDQILTITGPSWSDYQKFESPEYPGYRVSYINGEITIVSPGRNHERIAEIINRLIIAYCEKYELQDFPFGQTRLEISGQAGREPDLAYAFNADKDLPDLAVEVIFRSDPGEETSPKERANSGDIETLKSSYKNIGIPELWVWKDNVITFYYLEQNNYIVLKSSRILDRLESESFVKYINRGITESPSAIKKDFLQVI